MWLVTLIMWSVNLLANHIGIVNVPVVVTYGTPHSQVPNLNPSLTQQSGVGRTDNAILWYEINISAAYMCGWGRRGGGRTEEVNIVYKLSNLKSEFNSCSFSFVPKPLSFSIKKSERARFPWLLTESFPCSPSHLNAIMKAGRACDF